MKKFLAILLSVIMLFTLGVTAFADDDADVEETFDPTSDYKAADPTPLEGKIILDIDNMYFEPSQTYSVPIRIYADAIDALAAIVEANGSGEAEDLYIYSSYYNIEGDALTNNSAEITNVRAATDAPIEVIAEGWDEDSIYDYVLFFKINKADFSTMLNTPEEGIIVGYVDITTHENFGIADNGDVKYGDELATISHTYSGDMCYFDENLTGAIGYVDENGDYYSIDYSGTLDDFLIYDAGHFYHSPRVLTWKERLTLWAVEQAKAFLNFFSVINDVLMSLLNGVEI